MMIDTGSTCNLLRYKEYNALPNKPNLQPTGNSAKRIWRKSSKNYRQILLESKHAYAEVLIYVSDNETADNLLGYSTAKKLKLVKVYNSVIISNEYSFIKEKNVLFSLG
jgi:hypothetical protein